MQTEDYGVIGAVILSAFSVIGTIFNFFTKGKEEHIEHEETAQASINATKEVFTSVLELLMKQQEKDLIIKEHIIDEQKRLARATTNLAELVSSMNQENEERDVRNEGRFNSIDNQLDELKTLLDEMKNLSKGEENAV